LFQPTLEAQFPPSLQVTTKTIATSADIGGHQRTIFTTRINMHRSRDQQTRYNK